MTIKVSLGKLNLPTPFTRFIDPQRVANSLVVTLPFHHRDPFDRLLVALSPSEGMPIIGNAALFDVYGVKRLW